MRQFNTAGPCRLGRDYMLPSTDRLPGAGELIDRGHYFVVHAPRQSGKTTTLRAWADAVSAAGDRVALYVSCESARAVGDDYGAASESLLYEIRAAAQKRDYPEPWLPPAKWPDAPASVRFNAGLSEWAGQCPVPIVLFFDEIDALAWPSMSSVLQQLRSGFPERPEHFPASVVLCGMRDVRDYKSAAGGNPSRTSGACPFNIAVKSIRIGNFSRDEVAALYGQHTAETGQQFTDGAVDRAHLYTAGQPWLVNSLAHEVIEEMNIPVSTTITSRHIDQAKERLIAARGTHFDSLVDKLADPRVRRIIETLINGREFDVDISPDVYNNDVSYARDLGLITPQGLAVSNPIYQDVLARFLAQTVSDRITASPRDFLLPDGRIDLDKLLRQFVDFWREQGELMAAGRGFEEAGVPLVLMGYLYRIVNGGGIIDPQYGIGHRRVDLLIRKPYTGPGGNQLMQREAVELKVWYQGESDPLDEGLDQLDGYLDRLGLDTGTLIIFDRRDKAAPLTERGVFTDEVSAEGRKVRLLRI